MTPYNTRVRSRFTDKLHDRQEKQVCQSLHISQTLRGLFKCCLFLLRKPVWNKKRSLKCCTVPGFRQLTEDRRLRPKKEQLRGVQNMQLTSRPFDLMFPSNLPLSHKPCNWKSAKRQCNNNSP